MLTRGFSRCRRFSDKERVKQAVTLGPLDTIKVSLTTKDGSKAKRPHQAFLLVKEASGLEAPFPLTIKESGKATVEFVRLTRLPPPATASTRETSNRN